MKNDLKILFRGAGDFASGSIRRLKIAGFNVVATELPEPLAIRRGASFSEVVYIDQIEIEGVTGVLANIDNYGSAIADGHVAVVVDPECSILKEGKWDIFVDGRMTKIITDTKITDAPVVIGMGPGFTGGVDCHAVIETNNGDNLGRVIYEGVAEKYTGIPKQKDLDLSGSDVGNADLTKLVYFAESGGTFVTDLGIADDVASGDVLGYIDGSPMLALSDGILRGILHTNLTVNKGAKLIEIDPERRHELCYRISAKANAMAGGVLEAVYSLTNSNNSETWRSP